MEGRQTAIEVKVQMIYDGKEGDILYQYIMFTKVYNEQSKKYGRMKNAIQETFRICKDRNILKEYLGSIEKGVVGIMAFLYDTNEIADISGLSLEEITKLEANVTTL